jgi:hypothetical protein
MRRLLLRVLLLTFAFVTLGGLQSLDVQELRCEEAVQRLVDCCPRFDPESVDCENVPAGCDSNGHAPDISETVADELAHQSCDEIVASQECALP